jgi:hypothetical protein
MKTINFLLVSLMTSVVLFSACQKDELDVVPTTSKNEAEYKAVLPAPPTVNLNWQDDFTSASSLPSNWNLYGKSLPTFVPFAGNRYGLFDNNGKLPDGSFAVSKRKIGYGRGYTIESDVFIDVNKPLSGTVICPEIGVAQNVIEPSSGGTVAEGISMKLMYIGQGVSNVDPAYHTRTVILMSVLLQNGNIITSGELGSAPTDSFDNYALPITTATSKWHKMKIVVNSLGRVSFYLDNKFVWSPAMPAHPSLMKNRSVVLGFSSPGNGGKAYHDYVKVTYPSNIELQSVNSAEQTIN